MKINRKSLGASIAVPLIAGAVIGLLTANGAKAFSQLNKPALSPPSWLFPAAWTVLYTLMGIASYCVRTASAPKGEARSALRLYTVQLAINLLWPVFFFDFGLYLFSFFWLLLLWVIVLFTLISFYRISKPAGLLLAPYLLWLTFAAYLNLFVCLLN